MSPGPAERSRRRTPCDTTGRTTYVPDMCHTDKLRRERGHTSRTPDATTGRFGEGVRDVITEQLVARIGHKAFAAWNTGSACESAARRKQKIPRIVTSPQPGGNYYSATAAHVRFGSAGGCCDS